MRIIAGEWRGRLLAAPAGEKTRPILDRTKVVLFDLLGSRLAEPGYLPPINVLDLFAGAGTLGLECLSRGAQWACFVEKGGEAFRVLRDNVASLHAENISRIIRGDATSVAIPEPPEGKYTLIFVDPPYRMTEKHSPGDRILQRLDELARHPAVADDAILVYRQEHRSQTLPAMAAWPTAERKPVGTMVFTLLSRTASELRASSERSDGALDEGTAET